MALLFARCVNFKVFAEEYGVGKELARREGAIYRKVFIIEACFIVRKMSYFISVLVIRLRCFAPSW